jgi:hypothetical protein
LIKYIELNNEIYYSHAASGDSEYIPCGSKCEAAHNGADIFHEKRLDTTYPRVLCTKVIFLFELFAEQFTVHKKLIEREQALYASVMANWKNSTDFAAAGGEIPVECSDGVEADPGIMVGATSNSLSKKRSSPASARRGCDSGCWSRVSSLVHFFLQMFNFLIYR